MQQALLPANTHTGNIDENTRLQTIINDSVFLIIVIGLIMFYEGSGPTEKANLDSNIHREELAS
jgi:hypothetical protein